MIDWILRAKPWVLFVLIYVLPYVLMTIGMGSVGASLFSTAASRAAAPPAEFISQFAWLVGMILLLSMFPLVLLLGWFYGVADRVAPIAARYIDVNPTRLRGAVTAGVVTQVLYFVAIAYSFYAVFGALDPASYDPAASGGSPPDGATVSAFFTGYLVAMGVGVFAFAIWIYILVQVARVIKAVEHRRAGSEGVVGAFFGLLFFFVGVWIYQPIVNRVANSDYDDELALEDGLIE